MSDERLAEIEERLSKTAKLKHELLQTLKAERQEVERLQAKLYRKDERLKSWIAAAEDYERRIDELEAERKGTEYEFSR